MGISGNAFTFCMINSPVLIDSIVLGGIAFHILNLSILSNILAFYIQVYLNKRNNNVK